MKTKHLCVLTLIMLISSLVFAQHKKDRPSKEKLKSMKVAYITEKVDLTPAEAEKFWPVFNEFETKMDASHKAIRKLHKKEDLIDEMTDEAVEKMITDINKIRQKEFTLQKAYHTKFKAILPIKKVAKLYKANHEFMREILKKIKDHKGPPPGKRPH